jgi:acyl-CoA thioester hydrolase
LFGRTGETPAAVGHFVHVFVQRAAMRPVPIPEPIRAALEALRLQV